jgi:hypothetical protein
MLWILVCSHALSSILSGCKLGAVGLSSRRCYHMVYGEFPCCLVGGRLDSVGADVNYNVANVQRIQSKGRLALLPKQALHGTMSLSGTEQPLS